MKNEKGIYDIKAYLDATDLSVFPGINSLAKKILMSGSGLKTAFKRIFGVPLNQYFTHVKLERARIQLESGEHAVKEVGYSIGYRNLSHFAKAYRLQFGIRPKESCPRIGKKPMHTQQRNAFNAERMAKIATFLANPELVQFPGVAQLATLFDISPTCLKTLFQETFGIHIKEYFKRKKLEQGHKLLLAGEACNTVSRTVGYTKATNFGRDFYDQYGIRPRLVRQKGQKLA